MFVVFLNNSKHTIMKKTLLIIVFGIMFSANSQDTIDVPKGYTNTIGQMVSMLDDLKARVERNVRNLNQEGTDFLLDENANSPGKYILLKVGSLTKKKLQSGIWL